MLTKENVITMPRIPNDLEEAEYPPEVIDRWNKEFEIMEYQLAIGEIEPKTVEELAAELGIVLDEDDD